MAYGIRSTSLLKAPSDLVPLVICPKLIIYTGVSHDSRSRRPRTCGHQLHTEALATASYGCSTASQLSSLPRSCPGCGAYTQNANPEQPGFYGTTRKVVKAFTARTLHGSMERCNEESKTFERIVGAADVSLLSQMGLYNARERETSR